MIAALGHIYPENREKALKFVQKQLEVWGALEKHNDHVAALYQGMFEAYARELSQKPDETN